MSTRRCEANPTYESQCREWAEAQSVSFNAHYVEGKGPYGHCVQYTGDVIWGFHNGEGVIAINKGGVVWSNSHSAGICSQADRACHCVVHPPSTPPPASPPLCDFDVATCTDHGADEAAALAACDGNPLCYVSSTSTTTGRIDNDTTP